MSTETDDYGRDFALLNAALELPPARREAYLSEACGGDRALYGRVLALLAAGSDDGRADAFAERSVEATRRAFEEALDGAAGVWLPEKIGRYRIVRQIGQGGMGIVYEATQESPRRSVAVKLLHPIQATPERLRRFQREVELLGRLQHPGIARIYEAGTYDVGRGPQPYFAMELVEGVDLRTHCARRGQVLPTAECGSCEVGVACPRTCPALIELLASVCDAVHFAHEQGIVHRDLKPENVLVDRLGRPRVLDFGIARATDSGAGSSLLTEQGQIVGTLAYMAPELLNHATDAVTPQVDVYALGVMAFELLAGRLPHAVSDLSMSKAIALLTSSDPPLAGRFDPSLRGDVETILAKALDPEPGRRYASAAALADDLRRTLAHQPIEARPPSRVYLVRKFARRHRGLTAGALATFSTLVAGIVVALLLARNAQEQRDEANTQREFARENAARAIHGTLQSAQLLIEAGRGRDAVAQLALVPEEARGLAWRLLDRAVPFVLDEDSADWHFLDDEHLVGVVGESVVVYSLIEHRRIREGFQGLGLARVPRAAPCGLVVAYTQADPERVELATDEVLLLDLEREAIVRRAPLSVTGQWRWPETSDDGRAVLWYTSASEAEVAVDGRVVHVVEGLSDSEAAHLGPDGRFLAVNRRAEVSVLDLETGALRLRYAPGPEDGASGFPVRGGVLLYSSREERRSDGPQVWRRFDLGGEALFEPVSPFASGFSVEPIHHLFSYTRDGRVVAARMNRGGVQGAYLGNTETGLPLESAGLTRDGQGQAGFLEFPEATSLVVQLSPSGRRVLTTGWERGRIVELEPGSPDSLADPRARTLRGHTDAQGTAGSGWIYHLAVSSDGSLIASSAPADPLVRVWDARTGETVATLRRDCGQLHDTNPGSWESLMAFDSADDHLLLTTPYGGRGLCLLDWNLVTGEIAVVGESLPQDSSHLLLLDRFLEQLAPVDDVRLSQRVLVRDGQALVAFEPPTPGLRDMSRPAEGARWRYVPGIEGQAQGLSLHPGLPRAAVVDQLENGLERTGRLTVVDTRTGAVLVQRKLAYKPWCVAYAPDGSVLAIGTNTGDVLLFETERHSRQLVWRAHEGLGNSYVYSLAWTSDGTRLVTASGDGTLKIWDTRTRVASRLDEERFGALRAQMAGRTDLREAFDALSGVEREAARVELMVRPRHE